MGRFNGAQMTSTYGRTVKIAKSAPVRIRGLTTSARGRTFEQVTARGWRRNRRQSHLDARGTDDIRFYTHRGYYISMGTHRETSCRCMFERMTLITMRGHCRQADDFRVYVRMRTDNIVAWMRWRTDDSMWVNRSG